MEQSTKRRGALSVSLAGALLAGGCATAQKPDPLVLPLLGPSSVRDAPNLLGEIALSPQSFSDDVALRNSLTALEMAHARADLLPMTSRLDGMALDRYLFVRDAYLQRRRYLVHDGDPPAEPPADTAESPESFHPKE